MTRVRYTRALLKRAPLMGPLLFGIMGARANHTTPHTIEITGTTFIPEFPTTTILPLLITTFLMTLVQLKRKHRK